MGVIVRHRSFPAAALAAALLIIMLGALASSAFALTSIESLGKKLYWDSRLSTPDGQSCADCHDPVAGWADPVRTWPVSQGVLPTLFGGRNSPPAAYAAYSPSFHWDSMKGVYAGGQFWDGRADDLVEQAKGPFLNPVEMANPDKAAVVEDVRTGSYASLFKKVFGRAAFNDVDAAYADIAVAIAAYESSTEVNRFSSKFDAVVAGRASFTSQEHQGFMLFRCQGGCSSCHTVGGMGGSGCDGGGGGMGGGGMGGGGMGGGGMGGGGMGGGGMGGGGMGGGMAGALFTDFSYRNLGLPYNPAFLEEPLNFAYAPDLGLGGRAGFVDQAGAMKVPSLRNVAKSAPYGHNGYFATLREIVDFYNTRDVDPAWPDPEVPENVSMQLGDLGLTDADVDAIVAFLKTLSDGYFTP
jgi:cytochrome c peroxidase